MALQEAQPEIWTDSPTSSRPTLGLVALLFLVACAVALRAPSLSLPFFADDFAFLEQVRNRPFLEAVTAHDRLGHYGRPIGRQAYFWSLTQLFGDSPLAFHLANCLLFAGSILLLFFLVRRYVRDGLALIAAAFLSFHYAADPLLQWASGSQDLLALFFSLVALHLFARNLIWLSAVSLALALLSKEVAIAAIAVVFAIPTPRPRFQAAARRALPLVGVAGAWAIWRLFEGHQQPVPLSWIAAGLIHLVQVSVGAEIGRTSLPSYWWVAPILVAFSARIMAWIIAKAPCSEEGAENHASSKRLWLLRVGGVWAMAGTLAIIPALDTWSAYYYVFALCGVGLVVAGIVDSLPRNLRTAAIVLLLTLPSVPRYRESFAVARSPWTWESHVNWAYLTRGTTLVTQYVSQLKQLHPALPPSSTLFFSNVPAASGLLSGDGALIRWAYEDSSLRSYFLSEFTRPRARRGPFVVLAFDGNVLHDWTNEPLVLPGIAYALLRDGHPRGATEALDLALEHPGSEPRFQYWRAWTRWALGDTVQAKKDLGAVGMHPERTSSPLVVSARQFSTNDELMRWRKDACLDPSVHSRLAKLWLPNPMKHQDGVIEAYAAHLLNRADASTSALWLKARTMDPPSSLSTSSVE